jgi:hypothetical protein
VRSRGVIVSPPRAELYFSIFDRPEQLQVQAFVAQLVVEAFDIGLFPGCSGLDISASDPLALEPVLNRLGNELWSIVATQVLRRAITLDHCLQYRDRINGPGSSSQREWLSTP